MTKPDAARTPADLPSRAELLSVSGLEYMHGVQTGRFPAAPIAALLNYTIDEVGAGRVTFRGTPLFQHCNPTGAVHGGWYGTVLDTCMGCAVMTGVPKGSIYTTLEYKVNIIRPIPPGTEIVATGLLQHAGRSTGVANGDIRGHADGRLYATGSTTCIIMKMAS